MTQPDIAKLNNLSPDEKRSLLKEILSTRLESATKAEPVSYGQQALWYIHQSDPENAAYNISLTLKIESPVQSALLRDLLQQLVDRHAALRTTFGTEGSELVQIVHDETMLSFTQKDVSGWSPSRVEEQVEQGATVQFDLENGPLLHVTLLSLAHDEHLLQFVIHHIISDGWSLWMLLEELRQLYIATYNRSRPSLSSSPSTYVEYVRWQQAWLASEDADSQWQYWRAKLSGELPILDLRTDFPRPVTRAYDGRSLDFLLSPNLSRSLKELAKREGVTLYMLLIAAYQLLLHRHTGQPDLLVGTPATGRTQTKFAQTVGYFINPIVLRSRLSAGGAFREFLQATRDDVLDALNNQDFPLSLMVQRLLTARDQSRAPLFEAWFVMQQAPKSADAMAQLIVGNQEASLTWGDLTLKPYKRAAQEGDFDLGLHLIEADDQFHGSLLYNGHLFEADTVARLCRHYIRLLESIVDCPDGSVTRLPILTEPERNALITEWATPGYTAATNKIAVNNADDGSCLHDLITQQAIMTPEAAAVIGRESMLTYGELDAESTHVANYLQQQGIGPDSRVGICMNRTPQMLVTLVGILKAGGAYVPLDPSYPEERLRYIVEDSNAELLLTERSLALALPFKAADIACPLVNIEHVLAENALAGSAPATGGAAPSTPANLAYVIYTSGSAGHPKGVCVTHSNVLALFDWAGTAFPTEELTGLLASTSVCFDLSVFELFLPLCIGGSVILADSALDIATLPAREQVTFINTVPSAMAELLRQNAIPYSVKTIGLGGEALPNKIVQALYTQAKSKRVYNLYGPTEDTVYSTASLTTAGATDAPTIGRPINATQTFILDREGEPTPIGVVGELCLGGAGLTRGYLGQPAQTAQYFVPNPFSPESGSRLYRTGDLARYRPDGEIEFLGRMDFQVKVRGFRVELGEIELALDTYKGVERSVVVVRPSTAGDLLVAYLAVEEDHAPEPDQLRTYLSQKLPHYAVPSAFILLKALPLTPNGKIDRRALPEPAGRLDTTHDYAPPTSATEEKLVAIWQAVLDHQPIGIHDNFFLLGGHSLAAIQIRLRIEQMFGLVLPMQTLFRTATIADLALAIAQAETSEQPLAEEIPVAPRLAPLPLSSTQQRLWFLAQIVEANAPYNIFATVEISGDLQLDIMRQAITQVVQRHEVLRTRFPHEAGTPYQLVMDEEIFQEAIVDLRTQTATEVEAELRRLAMAEAAYAFDLTSESLLRVTIVHLPQAEPTPNGFQHHQGTNSRYAMMLNMHHIIADGWSINLFLDELAFFYNGYLSETEPELPSLPIQYADFTLWQQEQWEAGRMDAHLAYWVEQLRDASPLLTLPTDRQRPAIQTYNGSIHHAAISSELLDALKSFSQASNVTLFTVLMGAFAALLHHYTSQTDIVIGVPVANRQNIALEKLIGCFINLLPMRVHADGSIDFVELLEHVHDVVTAGYEHENVPFEKVIDALQPDRSLSYSPIFQVMFAMQNIVLEQFDMAGITVESPKPEAYFAKYDLSLLIWEDGDSVTCIWEFNTDLFDATTIERMAQHFLTLLEGCVATPRKKIMDLTPLMPTERQQVLTQWNDTDVQYTDKPLLHKLFEQQVQQSPDRPAVLFGDESVDPDEAQTLTYAELNAKANQVAHYLCQQELAPETPIGVYMERSLEMVIALYGILKAGCAYVPLDPTYPQDRVEFMLADTNVPLVLTQHHLRGTVAEQAGQILVLDADWAPFAKMPETNVETAVESDNLAYVIYTSGSTGTPKGAMNSHRAICNRLEWMQAEYQLTTQDNVLQKTPFSFDVSVWEFFWPLLTGSQLIVAKPEGHKDALYLQQVIDAYEITTLHFVPPMLHSFLDVCQLGSCPSLRHVICSGEALPYELQQRFHRIFAAGLHNLYGPTEAAVDVTYWPTQMNTNHNIVPIGYPVANTSIYLLNRQMEPVPIGVSGELYIGGVQVGRGYYNRPALTAEKFVPNPFGDGRLYRSGDLARRLGDGSIEFLGRLDHQIKLRGFRIELGELEAALMAHPAIKMAVVLLQERSNTDKRLVAYITPVAGEDGLPQSEADTIVFDALVEAGNNDAALPSDIATTIRSFLSQQLPDYMVPAIIVPLGKMPLLPNGKINRKLLSAPSEDNYGRSQAYVAPGSALEQMLMTIWSDVLGVERIGIHDNFFELGGHSLLITQIASRVRQVFDTELPVRTLFENPTIDTLATTIIGAMGSAETTEIIAQTWLEIEQLPNAQGQELLAGLRTR